MLGPVTATDITNTSILLKWNEPTYGGIPEAYLIEKQLQPDGRWEPVSETPRERDTQPSIIINNLEPGSAYHFRVKAKFSFCDSRYTQTEAPITTLRTSQLPRKSKSPFLFF